MRRLLLVLPLLFMMAASPASADIVDDIIALSEKNVSMDVIVAFLDRNAEELRDLTAADIARMMDAKVPDRVVEAVLRRRYGLPLEPAKQVAAPQESTPQGPQENVPRTEETATPPEPEGAVTYVAEPTCPVPIFYAAPEFGFGVDVFGSPHQHHRNHPGGTFPFSDTPQNPDHNGHKSRPPHHGWTSEMPPATQAPGPRPATGQPGRPVLANTAPQPSTANVSAQSRPVAEHAAMSQVHAVATHVPSQIASPAVQAPVVHETHSVGGSYSGGSSFHESAGSAGGREGRR